jgi:hypothetical protein
MTQAGLGDLIILVADRNMEAAVQGLLSRQAALGIRSVNVQIRKHPQKDSGCCYGGVEFLSLFVAQFDHALLMFDREGSGRDEQIRADIENEIEARLSNSGWQERARTIVLDPELEIWVWSDSPHVASCLGFHEPPAVLRQWLVDRGFSYDQEGKPARPKEAMEAVLHANRIPRSSAIYRELAEKVSLRGCRDRAFRKFRDVMHEWFGSSPQTLH